MHVGGGSTSQVRTAMLIQRFRSTMEYYRRHATGSTRLFWTSLVRLRWTLRLVRDSARLLVTVNHEKREQLRGERSAWSAAIFSKPVSPVQADGPQKPGPAATPGVGSGA
jgi:hypothetical protein